MRKKVIISIFFISFYSLSFCQQIDIEHITYQNAKNSLDQLKSFLALPNDAHYPEDIQKNIDWSAQELSKLGFLTKQLDTKSVPLLLATPAQLMENKPTILFYYHIDGQPVDSSFWFQDNPYHAVLKEEIEGEGWVEQNWSRLKQENLNPDWKIFARSSSDDKSPFMMCLTAMKTLQQEGQTMNYNLKIILDCEEEVGSPNLAQAVLDYKKDLAADMLIIYDGPKHSSNVPTVTFGARGITTMTLKVFGPTFPLHSGHYGNYAPNPALRLSKLLSSMKDDVGRVTIPGYYDGIELSPDVKSVLAAVPDHNDELMLRLGIGETDQIGTNYQESLQYPSLNIRGMSSAWTGQEARTIVPATATAELDLRLVVESDGDRLKELVRQHIIDQGYHITDQKPTSRARKMYQKICQINSRGVTKPFRTDFDSALGIWVCQTIQNAFGIEPIRLRTMGGTLPTSPFISTLNVPAVVIPLVNSDNNQHSPNENLRLGNYFDGVKTIYELLISRPE